MKDTVNPARTTAVMFASGGVGEFLFQLDLAKRFDVAGVPTYVFVKKRYMLFAQMSQLSTIGNIKLISLESGALRGLLSYAWLCLTRKVVVVNSFNSLYFGVVTKCLYAWALITGNRVVVSKKDTDHVTFLETVPYQKEEVIWKRNNRIVEHVTGASSTRGFPIVFTDTNRDVSVPYIHIHPVGSTKEKSYPVKKLIELFELQKDMSFMFTLTPAEAAWYVTEELRDYLRTHDHVTLNVKYFHASEVISFMTAAKCFVTVNTGLLWLACMNSVKTVVVDTFTDFEWNPALYSNVTRLSHDYDEEGKSLHLVTKHHEDGTYFESMYRVTPEEVSDAINRVV